jgi:hypothetical protein
MRRLSLRAQEASLGLLQTSDFCRLKHMLGAGITQFDVLLWALRVYHLGISTHEVELVRLLLERLADTPLALKSCFPL